MRLLTTHLVLSVAALSTVGCQSSTAGPELQLLVPSCKVVREDSDIALAECPSIGVGYFFKSTLVPSLSERVAYNEAMNGILFGGLYRLAPGGYELDTEALRVILPTPELQNGFVKSLYTVRNSEVWREGHKSAAYEILLEDFFSPGGLQLVVQGLAADAKTCQPSHVDPFVVVDVAARLGSGAGPQLAATAACAIEQQAFQLSLTCALGLAFAGEREVASSVFVSAVGMREALDFDAAAAQRARDFFKKVPLDASSFRQEAFAVLGLTDTGSSTGDS